MEGMRKTALFILAILLAAPLLLKGNMASAASSNWQFIDGAGINGINVAPASKAENPAITVWNNEVYAAWQERASGTSINQIRVKQYNDSGWTSIDGNGTYGLNVNTGKAATRPAMAVFGEDLYVAWTEQNTAYYNQIRVKKFDGEVWSSADGGGLSGINADASKSADMVNLTVYDNALYAAWSEAGQIRVKSFDGDTWTSVDGGATGLNISGSVAGFPVMTVFGDDLIAAWSEVSGSNYQLRVKKYDGESWTTIDGGATGLNIVSSKSAVYPSLAVVGNALYAAWDEPTGGTDNQIRVKKYDGETWTSIDGGGTYGINVNPAFRGNYVELKVYKNQLYAIWQEHTGTGVVFKIRVKKYDGENWTSAEEGTNGLIYNVSSAANYPSALALNDVLYVAWQEKNSVETQIRVASYTEPPPPSVNSVSVSPSTASLMQGESRQLAATVDTVGGAATTVTWTSSDTDNKVTVSGSGYVTAAADAAPGNYVITAISTADSSKSGTATITVTAAPAVNSVSVSPSTASLMQGESRQLAATVDTVGGAATTVTWTSSDTDNKVTVSGSGYVTAAADAAPGNYVITAISTADSSKSGTATITVTAAPAVNSVSVSPSTASLMQGESRQLAVTVDTVGGAATTVTWTSSDTDNKVTVSGSGYVTAAADAAPGNYVITAISTADSSKSGTATITVTAAPTYLLGDIADQTMTAIIQGYAQGAQETKTIPLVNTGTGDLMNLSVSLGGEDTDSFTVTQPDSTTLGGGESTSFDLHANDDLPSGTYTTTVTVSAEHMTPVTFDVTQVVNLPNAPVNPQNLSAVGGDRSVSLSWESVSDATQYRIYISLDADPGSSVEMATVTSSTYSVNGLLNGVHYSFFVKAENAGGLSGASNAVSATPATIPGTPTEVTAVAGNGQALVTFTAPNDNGGSPITGYEVTSVPGNIVVIGDASPIIMTGLTNGTSYTFTIKAINGAGSSEVSAESNAVTPLLPDTPTDPTDPTDPSDTETPSDESNAVDILVNGKIETAGFAKISKRNNQSEITIVVDQTKLEERLAAEGTKAVVTIPINQPFDIAVAELNGEMVKSMENKDAVLVFKTDQATYTLPAQQLHIGEIAQKVVASAVLQDIKVRIEIAVVAGDALKQAENAAAKGGFTLVTMPRSFTVTAVYEDRTIELEEYDVYVERTVTIPDGIDPTKITTGVVLEEDGTVRHVPTRVRLVNGKYEAQINSLTNSAYAVVWHPLEFEDAAQHWARNAINDMGSRMVVDGTGKGMFGPDLAITRAEFTAIIVSGLGLKLEKGATPFSDVSSDDWYSRAIYTAYRYRLISGVEDGSFRPNEQLTREQAMVILSRAMVITGLKEKLSEQTEASSLRIFQDAEEVSAWAQSAAADNAQAGIVVGRGDNLLAPKRAITRAEVAVMIERLLQKSNLI
ncbi:S-layer homology domain-containing protein [Paenibacillus sp. HB172176]|uniref:S-layer homology domain-containing protein n=1 Tax=Paenibacillus sp. HB172176 TaxID=2493690 RepID=UPI00143C6D75|nr:S-layer homology domain-containing protein [Paenibacillus sp. HB172176]